MTFRTPFEPAQRGESADTVAVALGESVTMRASILRKAGTRGVSTIDPARSKPQHHIAPAGRTEHSEDVRGHAACL